MLSKSSIQFSVDGWCYILSFLFNLRPNYGGGNEDNGGGGGLVAKSRPTLTNPMDCSHKAPLSTGFSRQE